MRDRNGFPPSARMAAALVLFLTANAFAGVELFDPIDTAPYFSYEGLDGDSSQDAANAPATYSLFYDATDPDPAGNALSIGFSFGSAVVTQYTPGTGSPDTVPSFYPGGSFIVSTNLLVTGAVSTVAEVVDGATTYVVADFQTAGSQVLIGTPGTDFAMVGQLYQFDAGLPAMRVWGEKDTGVGQVQLVFELTSEAKVPDEPDFNSVGALPTGTLLFFSGDVTLGQFTNGEDELEQWQFTTDLWTADFGGTTTGDFQESVVPEPGTLLLMGLGGLLTAAAARRRRR